MLRNIAVVALFTLSGALLVLSVHVLVFYGVEYPSADWRLALADPLWRTSVGLIIVSLCGLWGAVLAAK